MENLMFLYGLRGFMTKCSRPDQLDVKDLKNESIEKAYKVYIDEISNNE